MHHFVKMLSLSDRERNELENSIEKCNFFIRRVFRFSLLDESAGSEEGRAVFEG